MFQRQDLLNSRLNELELQLQNLKQEINRDKEDFNEISDSLEVCNGTDLFCGCFLAVTHDLKRIM